MSIETANFIKILSGILFVVLFVLAAFWAMKEAGWDKIVATLKNIFEWILAIALCLAAIGSMALIVWAWCIW